MCCAFHDFIAIFYNFYKFPEEIQRDSEFEIKKIKKIHSAEETLKFSAYRAVRKYYTKIESFYTMKCDRRIGTLFASRVYTQYTSTFSARECKNKAVMCKPTIWIAALEHRGNEGVEEGIQSSVRGWAYLIRGRYRLHTRRTIIQDLARQIRTRKASVHGCVHNTCATRGTRENPESVRCYWTRI